MAPGPGSVELAWPTQISGDLVARVAGVVIPVVELGGAVGWLSPPTIAAVEDWLTGVVAQIQAGDAALCVASVDGVASALGCWARRPGAVFVHSAELQKIMAHPSARGLGLGQTITVALVDHARTAGIETVFLGVRGNNHLAIALYASLGFAECGRIPDAIEVGDDRYDEVTMYLTLPRPAHLRLRGSQPSGPGSSPAPGARKSGGEAQA